VRIATNDSDESTYTITLKGKGGATAASGDGSGAVSISLTGLSAHDGKYARAVAVVAPTGEEEVACYTAQETIENGSALLWFADPEDPDSPVVFAAGTEVRVGLFIDVNGVGPVLPPEFVVPQHPDYGDLVLTEGAYPTAEGLSMVVTVEGDQILQFGAGDYETYVQRLLHVTLTDDRGISEGWEGPVNAVVACYAEGASMAEDPPVAQGYLTLDPGVIATNSQDAYLFCSEGLFTLGPDELEGGTAGFPPCGCGRLR
jgi:hypothetical protein